jgi:hypothetical protein
VLPHVPVAPNPLLVREGSGVATCPVAPGTPPDWEGLWCRHVSCDSRPTPSAGGLCRCHVQSGPPPGRKGLRCHHDSRPTSRYRRALGSPHPARPIAPQGRPPLSPRVPWLQTRLRCGRALASSHAPWLSAHEVCPCVPKVPGVRLIMASPGMRSRQRIKCIQDKPNISYI